MENSICKLEAGINNIKDIIPMSGLIPSHVFKNIIIREDIILNGKKENLIPL
ncbi:MAG TPA: hypothetical protein PK886_01025 [Candidatus Paceibacterota bacterium]|nr:hypothetical protein [Candidatus Paceibacterota bacterium]